MYCVIVGGFILYLAKLIASSTLVLTSLKSERRAPNLPKNTWQVVASMDQVCFLQGLGPKTLVVFLWEIEIKRLGLPTQNTEGINFDTHPHKNDSL